jgi:sec-independent protein translocase protein TatB
MFDIGFSELIVIGIVALVVVGPERLPKVARTAGLFLGRLQRYVADVKADISREMQLEELKKLQAEVRESARDLERGITDELRSIGRDVGEAVDSIGADAPSAPSSGANPAADKTADEAADAGRAALSSHGASLPAAKG